MDKRTNLTPGETYAHTNGDKYVCRGKEFGASILERVSDGWTLRAHGVRINEYDEIYWDYSTNGHWNQERIGVYANR